MFFNFIPNFHVCRICQSDQSLPYNPRSTGTMIRIFHPTVLMWLMKWILLSDTQNKTGGRHESTFVARPKWGGWIYSREKVYLIAFILYLIMDRVEMFGFVRLTTDSMLMWFVCQMFVNVECILLISYCRLYHYRKKKYHSSVQSSTGKYCVIAYCFFPVLKWRRSWFLYSPCCCLSLGEKLVLLKSRLQQAMALRRKEERDRRAALYRLDNEDCEEEEEEEDMTESEEEEVPV